MEKMTYSKKELAAMFQCSQLSIWKMERDGRLKRLHNLPGCMYRAKEVEELLELGEARPHSPFEWRRLEGENARLRDEVRALQNRLARISAMALGTLPDEQPETAAR